MKTIKTILILSGIALFVRCADNPATEQFTVEKRIQIETNTQPVTDLLDSITIEKYIPLNFDDSNILIHEASHIKELDKRLYFVDKKRRTLYCIDDNGKLLFKIDRQGRGLGEYLELKNFEVDASAIYIMDNLGTKLLLFDRIDGHYLDNIMLDKSCEYEAIAKMNDSTFLLLTKGADNLFFGDGSYVHLYNHKGERIKTTLNMLDSYNKRIGQYRLNHSLFRRNDTVFLQMMFSDDVYAITPNDVRVKYRLAYDFREDIAGFMKNYTALSDDDFRDRRAMSDMIITSSPIVETQTHMLIPMDLPHDKTGLAIRDKRSGKTKTYHNQLSALHLLLNSGNAMYGGEGSCLYTVINNYEITMALSYYQPEHHYSTNIRRAVELITELGVREEDNPVILKFELPRN